MNPVSVSDIANAVMAITSVSSLVFTVVGLAFVAWQVSHTHKQATGQFLFELDSQFRSFADVHAELMDDHDATYKPGPMSVVWSYIGLFERCKVLIDHRTLDMKTFDDFYGYRLYSVVANETFRDTVQRSPERHQYFIRLCNQVLKYKKARGLNEIDRAFAEHIKNFKLLPKPVVDWRVPYEADTTWRTM